MVFKIDRFFTFILFSLVFGSCETDLGLDKHDHDLPVVELEIREKYLWSPDSGLYIVGSNGIGMETCETVANYNQKWEFPAIITFWDQNQMGFRDSVGFRIKGKCSRSNSMKSIGLYWRKEYGKRSRTFDIFPGSYNNEYKRLILRNSGNDFGRTHMKDAMVSQIVKDFADVVYQNYRPVVVYLNDEYWGIHNLRESITPHHFTYHFGVIDDQVDLLEGSYLNPEVDDGSREEFLGEVIYFMQNNDLSKDDHYNEISGKIDISSFIDLHIIETYIYNRDWPVNNTKWWREKYTSGYAKWRWILYDTDFSFELDNVNKVWIGDLYNNVFYENKADGFFMLNALLRNEQFKEQFLNRYMFFLEHVFDPDRVSGIIDRMRDNIDDEYHHHQAKWNTMPYKSWKNAIDDLKTFNRKRNAKMRKIIESLINET